MHDIHTRLTDNYRRADRLMLGVVWLLFVASLALSGMHDTLRWALMIGLPAALVASVAVAMASGTLATRLLVAAMAVVLCALHIQQAAGLTEFHFGLIALLALFLAYRDWRVIVVATVCVAVHHFLFNYLQALGYGVICLATPDLATVLVHAAYVVVEAAILTYISVTLERDAVKAAELLVRVAALTAPGDGVVDLSTHALPACSAPGAALRDAVGMLGTSIAHVRDGTDAIASASVDIAAGNFDLSARTEQQASALEEIASTLEQSSASVTQNADHARQASTLAASASALAARSGGAVAQVATTMAAMGESSRQIVDIISVIDGIAFQTNILALNAAVEAARAGEQGRGFAVVASEVRNLAQRAAAAAQQIKRLIGETVEKIDTGAEHVAYAGATMNGLIDEIGRVSAMVSAISTASAEQSAGIGQITAAITQMDEVTQQNAALAEKSSASTQCLRDQAHALAQVVGTFLLDADDAAAAPPARAPSEARRPRDNARPGAAQRQLAWTGAAQA